MKVALIHDHLAQDGGAERVFKVISEIFPEADIYTLLYDKKNILKYYPNRRVDASIIQRLPGVERFYKWYLPLMPMAVEFFDLRGYDLVVSDTSSFAKGVITSPDTLHVCYCHTPTRYLWSDTHQYINELPYNKYFKKVIAAFLNYTRMWDRQAADRVDVYIANSAAVQKRIMKYYRRQSEIIYPPLDTSRFKISKTLGDFFLAGCRLVPYKRIDIVIEAFLELKLPLKIFGYGPDMPRLKKIAGTAANIEFLGEVSEEKKIDLMSRALAFINPQDEDFGITTVESLASGRPVIGLDKSGTKEIIADGITGILLKTDTKEEIIYAVKSFDINKFKPQDLRQEALKYDIKLFKEKLQKFIKQAHEKFIKD